jgi:hypothetical protein
VSSTFVYWENAKLLEGEKCIKHNKFENALKFPMKEN